MYNLTMSKISKIIGANLSSLRKSKKWTQAELAFQLNYSDKAISKWETGETTPDIDTLLTLANLYNVSLDYLVTEHQDDEKIEVTKPNYNKIIITALSASINWFIATIFYVYGKILFNENWWLAFVIAVPATIILLIVFNGIWGRRVFTFILVSLLIWTFLASIYLIFLSSNIWPIFLLGIPGQIAVLLWTNLKRR